MDRKICEKKKYRKKSIIHIEIPTTGWCWHLRESRISYSIPPFPPTKIFVIKQFNFP